MRAVLVVLVSSLSVACIPPPKAAEPPPKPVPMIMASTGVTTKIEKTTVIVKDAAGQVMRIEEKEQVLQEYQAVDPVEMKQAKSPPAMRTAVPAVRVTTGSDDAKETTK